MKAMNFDRLRSNLPYSLYLALGVLLNQLLHINVYRNLGVDKLATWYARLGLWDIGPSVHTAFVLCCVLALATFLVVLLTIPSQIGFKGIRFIKRSFPITLLIILASQLAFSSVMRLVLNC